MESIIKSNTRKTLVMILGSLWILTIIVLCYCGCHMQLLSLENDSTNSQILKRFGKTHKNSSKNGSSADIKFVCYYAIPNNRSTEALLTIDDVDPTLCTHIIASKAIIENTTIVPENAGDLKLYAEVVALKKQNPELKVILSLGSGFSPLVQDRMAVAMFAYNAHKFLITHGFDGLDLDWEFPAWPPGKKLPKEKTWFTYLLLQLNSALKLASHPPLLLTVTVGATQSVIDNSYEIDQLAKCVDFVSFMGYNYHMFKPYLPFTGHNSPLNKSSNEEGYFSTLNIQWDTIYLMKKGIPKEKLVIGIPTFGRTWKLLESKWYGVGSPAVAEGMLEGKITYLEACIFVKEGATRYFDNESKVPYAVRDRDWVSYEDVASIKNKVQWILDTGFAGVMTWTLNSDDWAGMCAKQKFELHLTIKNMLNQQLLKN